jgi:hypothetical protein
MTTWTFGPAGYYTATWNPATFQVTITVTSSGLIVVSFTAESINAALAAPEYQQLLANAIVPGAPLSLVATTYIAGFTLINGTPIILTWTAPNDGNMHQVLLFGQLVVSSLQTGGAVNLNYNDPAGTGRVQQLFAGGLAAGNNVPPVTPRTVAPGSTVTVTQTAQTAGASILYLSMMAL